MNGQESFFAAKHNEESSPETHVVSSLDPRTPDLGHRALIPRDLDVKTLFDAKDHKVTLEPTSDRFMELR